AAYQLPISVEALSYKLPEDMPDDEGYAMLPRLAPLTAGFRKALIDSRFERRPLNEKVANARILEDGMPVKWAYAALSDGLFLCYPGSVEYPERYNARERPWYATGYGQYEPVWSEPYEDVDGQGRVLTCSVSLFDREGEAMGVVALDLDFSRALQGLLPSQEELGEKTACLLDASGNVIFSVGRDPHALDIREGQPFPVPTLVEAVLRKDAGLLLSPKAGETLALAFQRIPAMDWYYVEKAELDELLTQ
ncbi:MAG: hypothetical protein EOM20_21510, partial [Spartobacteria bacterium]|nr:hypothetical protein [Spartobacteria bacterium]